MKLPKTTSKSIKKKTVFAGRDTLIAQQGISGNFLKGEGINPAMLPQITAREFGKQYRGTYGTPLAVHSDGDHVVVVAANGSTLKFLVYTKGAQSATTVELDASASTTGLTRGAWLDGRLYLPTVPCVVDAKEGRAHLFNREIDSGRSGTMEPELVSQNQCIVYFDNISEDYWEGEFIRVSYSSQFTGETETRNVRIAAIERGDEISMTLQGANIEDLYGADQVFVDDELPPLENVIEHQGRLYYFGDNKIYVTPISHPTCLGEWGCVAESEDGYMIELKEKVTGGCIYGGEPIFFTEGSVIRVKGASAAKAFAEVTPITGVSSADVGSPAVVDNVVCYIAREGLAVFDGKQSRVVYRGVGHIDPRSVGASDGRVYYFTVREQNKSKLYAYDPKLDVLVQLRSNRVTYGFLATGGTLIGVEGFGSSYYIRVFSGAETIPEAFAGFCRAMSLSESAETESTETYIEFGEDKSPAGGFGPSTFFVDCDVESDYTLTVSIYYDKQRTPAMQYDIIGPFRGDYTIPLVPRRCGAYHLTLSTQGNYCLRELSTEWFE